MSDQYPPLTEVRRDLRVQWYRCTIAQGRLRELMQRSDRSGWMQAGGHLLLFVATGLLVYLFWSRQLWLGFAVALFLHGTCGSFIPGLATHELNHGTVFRSRRLNRAFLYGFCLLSWYDPFEYAVSHTYHHRYTLHPHGDREVLLPLAPTVGSTFLLQLFTVNLLTRPKRTLGKGGLIPTLVATVAAAGGVFGPARTPSREWLQALHRDQPGEERNSMWWSRLLLLFHGAVLVVSLSNGLWVVPIIVSCFPFIANWLTYFVGLPMHCGLRDNVPDFRKCVRSITLPRFVEFLYWHMNWHTEHHMYAGVPCYNLGKLHREVAADMPRPRTLVEAWREMRAIWRRQKSEPDYQFDTPLPEGAGSTLDHQPDVVEESIGELAPKGL